MTLSVPLVFYGPDRFCPDCGRWLVRIKPDGSFDLAGQTEIVGVLEIVPGEIGEAIDLPVLEAICLRSRCKRRRWWRGRRG